jgi:hypothetical protein
LVVAHVFLLVHVFMSCLNPVKRLVQQIIHQLQQCRLLGRRREQRGAGIALARSLAWKSWSPVMRSIRRASAAASPAGK